MSRHLFIIGGQRCGTTYLYQMLDEHPDIYMAKPVRPEPKFFIKDAEYSHGPDYYERKYFEGKMTTILGEKSTSYMEYPESAERMLSFYPDAFFVAILRNPVERAISNYFFSKDNGLETRTIEEVFLEDKAPPAYENTSVNPFDYLQRGKYADYLKDWMKLVPKEQLIVLIAEDFIGEIGAVQYLYQKLSIDDEFAPGTLQEKINTSKRQPFIPTEVVDYLYDYYRLPNQHLEELLGHSINSWKP